MIRALALLLAAGPAFAADLEMPGPATVTFTSALPLSSHRVALGPYADGIPFEVAEGAVTRTVWQIAAPDQTPLQILVPLRDQLASDGYEIVFECSARACGGFDFRFEIDVSPAPDMFVDLAAFRYLAARKGEEWVTLVVSTSDGFGYVQLTTVGPVGSVAPIVKSASNPVEPPPLLSRTDVAEALLATGRAVLSDLDFATGSSELAGDDYPSLAALAAFLTANPDVTIALVGHTDAEGGAEGNMAISRRRADSARALLTGRYGIAAARIGTFGVGFFAPIARNDTDAGRESNRRVEAVITSTD
ncbi:MAG: OmpA family protein [Jannaschia sp.]